jgi:MerR family copper efflux transcriptional regulator
MLIGDAAAAAGTTPRALRFYEENGLLPPPRRTAAGQRVYGTREVHRLRVIRQLLELGLTVADVRLAADRLDLIDGDQVPHYGPACAGDGAAIVQHRIAALDTEIARLTQLRNQLAARIVPPPGEDLASLPGCVSRLAGPGPATRGSPVASSGRPASSPVPFWPSCWRPRGPRSSCPVHRP